MSATPYEREGETALAETALTVDQILESMRQLSDEEKRTLAVAVLNERALEAFVEELDDHVACEEALAEDAEPFHENLTE